MKEKDYADYFYVSRTEVAVSPKLAISGSRNNERISLSLKVFKTLLVGGHFPF